MMGEYTTVSTADYRQLERDARLAKEVVTALKAANGDLLLMLSGMQDALVAYMASQAIAVAAK